jgi:hypothetical protein
MRTPLGHLERVRSSAAHPSARALLGRDHPYTRADADLRQAVSQLALTGLFALAAASFGHAQPGSAPSAAGAVVLTALSIRLVILADARRQRAMDLVIDGGEHLPISSVARLRRRLLGRRREDAAVLLARTVHDASDHMTRNGAVCPAPISDLQDDVTELVELLRCTISARPVAMTARLLQGNASWDVFVADADRLRRAADRIRFALAAAADGLDDTL